jgi:hypothetical protein
VSLNKCWTAFHDALSELERKSGVTACQIRSDSIAVTAVLLGIACVFTSASAADLPPHQNDTPRNWFNDPFFQVAHGIATCPVPAGPLLTDAERHVQSHHRAERGTSCWLSGRCDQASAYAHDADIARDLQSRWQATPRFDAASLWVTVQHGVVFIEGCVPPSIGAAEIEAFVKVDARVQQAVAIVHSDLTAKPAYKVLAPR